MKDNGKTPKERTDAALRLAKCEELEKIIKRLMDRHKGESNGKDNK